MNTIKRLISDERGLETAEYAVVGALIVAIAIVAIRPLGVAIAKIFTDLKTSITT